MPLTDSAIKSAKPKDKPYKRGDAQGLYIEVTPNGSKLWRLKYRIDGKEKRLALLLTRQSRCSRKPWMPATATC